MAHHSLLSVGQLCDEGYIVTFRRDTVTMDLQNDFTTGGNRYPKNRQHTLHLLDKYSKTVVPKVTHFEGTSFAHKGGRGSGRSYNGNGKGHESSTYDKNYWKDKECYKFHKMGNPETHCGKKLNSNEDDDSSAAATFNSVKKLQKDIKSIRKAFTTVNTQLENLKEGNPTFLSRKVKTKHHIFRWMQPSNLCRPKRNSSQESRD
jgi:hypothetical protein